MSINEDIKTVFAKDPAAQIHLRGYNLLPGPSCHLVASHIPLPLEA